jgi:hypothetical protein
MGPRTATRTLGRKPGLNLSSEGLFERGPGRDSELLKRKRQRQKWHEAKAHWERAGGASASAGPDGAGNVRCFRFLYFSASAVSFVFSQKNVGSIYCEKLVFFTLRSEKGADAL